MSIRVVLDQTNNLFYVIGRVNFECHSVLFIHTEIFDSLIIVWWSNKLGIGPLSSNRQSMSRFFFWCLEFLFYFLKQRTYQTPLRFLKVPFPPTWGKFGSKEVLWLNSTFITSNNWEWLLMKNFAKTKGSYLGECAFYIPLSLSQVFLILTSPFLINTPLRDIL